MGENKGLPGTICSEEQPVALKSPEDERRERLRKLNLSLNINAALDRLSLLSWMALPNNPKVR
jgi:hypothetical protein